jgi:hypothetical protein
MLIVYMQHELCSDGNTKTGNVKYKHCVGRSELSMFAGIITNFLRVCVRTQYNTKHGGGGGVMGGEKEAVGEFPQLKASTTPHTEQKPLSSRLHKPSFWYIRDGLCFDVLHFKTSITRSDYVDSLLCQWICFRWFILTFNKHGSPLE